jgi:uncharacterized protein (TIGR02246 family)
MHHFALNAVAALAIGLASTAFASDADKLREADDRAQIQELMWKYVRALDTLDEDAYAAVFTEDGEFGSAGKPAKGREALKKVVADVKKGRAEREAKGEPKSTAMHHVITNAHVEFIDKDHARYHAYWMTTFAGAGQGGTPPRVAAVGRSIDELVRVNGKWLIKSRNVAPKD